VLALAKQKAPEPRCSNPMKAFGKKGAIMRLGDATRMQ